MISTNQQQFNNELKFIKDNQVNNIIEVKIPKSI